MSEEKEVYAQDKIVEKIHKEEGLDENDNNYNVSDALSDSNQQDAEKDNRSDLVDMWKTIRQDREKHVHMLKDALENEFHK